MGNFIRCLACVAAVSFVLAAPASGAFFFDVAPPGAFSLINTNADGSVATQSNSIMLIGGDNLSLQPGTTDYIATAVSAGSVNFTWSYSSIDQPTFDFGGYLLNGNFFLLSDTGGQSGSGAFSVTSGESFGLRVGTADNSGGPGILTITAVSQAVPEPGTGSLILLCAVAGVAVMVVRVGQRRVLRAVRPVSKLALALLGVSLLAQNSTYSGTNITGRLVRSGPNVNLLALSQPVLPAQASFRGPVPEAMPGLMRKLQPPPRLRLLAPAHAPLRSLEALIRPHPLAQAASLPVTPSSVFGFNGLTHLDQRNASNGNQYSVEPPNSSIAAANGFILEGVNNAIQVYSTSGTPLLPTVLASNQVFGVPPAINRSTGISGIFPTDMRVFYDQGINRWFILQRAQCCDSAGNNINHSQIYIAVSQSGDPTGNYYNYFIDTTDSTEPGCSLGCVSDFPQIGADQYGFYISTDQYPLTQTGNPGQFPIGADILAISKDALASGANAPATYEFVLPSATGFEFAISPAVTPQGGSYSVGLGGVEFFVSSIATGATSLSVWAIQNTSSLSSASPNLTLIRTVVGTQPYSVPPNAKQKPGPLPYGSTVAPGFEAPLDSSDCRVLSVVAAAGRLYVAFDAFVQDETGRALAGAAYFVLSPTLRGTLAATVLAQGNLVVSNNNLLRPAFGVNAQGKGAVAFTLVGPDYFPSAAYVAVNSFTPPISSFSFGSAIQLSSLGSFPEDGFTGYNSGVARWGDYSTAVTGNDGSIWMVTEYIPNEPRTQFANWGTFLMHYVP